MNIPIGVSPVGKNGGHRKQAKILGKKYYFTGVPCSRQHMVKRKTKTGKCIECERENSFVKSRIRRNKNPEEVREYVRKYMKKWRAKNPDKYKESYTRRSREKARLIDRNLYRKYREKYLAKNKKYQKENREYFAVAARNRRALKSSLGKHTLKQIKELLNKQKWKCVYCKSSLKNGYHADHIVPLKKGGSNFIENIQCLCPSCNLSKNSRDALEWAREKGYA